MNGEGSADGQSLARYRDYLRLLVQMHLDPRLVSKADLSGVVQQTLLEAHQSMGLIAPLSEEQRLAWLRRVLANNLSDEIRKYRRKQRDVRREVSLEEALEHSSHRLDQWIAAEESGPVELAERQEMVLRLAAAIEQLPEAQREALVLQHWHGWTVAQIAERMERTTTAVAGLLKRGLKQLRITMKSE